MSDRPDPIVREETIREAVDTLASGIATHVRQSGGLPDSRAIVDYAQDQVAKQVKVHESVCDQLGGVPEKPKTAPSLREATEVEAEDHLGKVTHISRPLGLVGWNTKTNEMQVIGDSRLDRKLKRKMPHADAKDLREAFLVRQRMNLLMTKPEWEMKLVAAYHRGAQIAIMRGIYTDKEIESMAADEVLKVLDESNPTFGDWRFPKVKDPKIIVSG